MIEFILSKINLLILVIALFSIISFFTLNVGGIFLAGEVKQELDKYALGINGMIVAPTTCDSKPISIPNKFSSFGNNIFYKMTISQFLHPDSVSGTRVIFAVSDIKHPTTILAAASLSTQAEVVILDLTGGNITPLSSGEELVLDPQSVPPLNAFYAVKSVKLGRTTLYLFPCAITADSDTCPVIKGRINQWLSDPPNGGHPFVC